MDLAEVGVEFCNNHMPLNHSNKVIRRYEYIPEGGKLPAPNELPRDIRRNNFGNTYTNLSFQRDPFIHLLTKFKKKPTDDFNFTYAIKRNLAGFKRYGYVLGVGGTARLGADNTTTEE